MTRKYLLLLISSIFYTYLLQWKVLLFCGLSIVIIAATRVRKKQKLASFIAILMLSLGFICIKFIYAYSTILGYSVFAFTGISYIVDQYKSHKPYTIIDTLLYLFFFPKMLAGPFVRASEFIPQLSKEWNFTTKDLYSAFKLVVYALFIKLIIVDCLLNVPLYNYRGINLLCLTTVWGIKFYLDFYAYSILAVGAALLFGIKLPFNFDCPYRASSFKDFWKRWNVTLSSWLKDYIYIPLGGNRCSKKRQYFNIMATFIVSALWHGLNLPFIIWGIIHGMAVSLEHFVGRTSHIRNHIFKYSYSSIIFITVILLWQLFRLHNIEAITEYVHQLGTWSLANAKCIFLLLISFIVLACIDSKWCNKLTLSTSTSLKMIFCEAAIFTIILMFLLFFPTHYNIDFFYFKF